MIIANWLRSVTTIELELADPFRVYFTISLICSAFYCVCSAYTIVPGMRVHSNLHLFRSPFCNFHLFRPLRSFHINCVPCFVRSTFYWPPAVCVLHSPAFSLFPSLYSFLLLPGNYTCMQQYFRLILHVTTQARQCVQCRTPTTAVQYCCMCALAMFLVFTWICPVIQYIQSSI